jgi:nicotinamidase/pyrazinamidase
MNKKKVLLIVDLQHDFCEYGTLSVPYANEIIAPINAIIPQYDLVIASQDWHTFDHISFRKSNDPADAKDKWPLHCVANSHGAALHTDLDQTGIHFIMRKGYHKDMDTYSCFFHNDRVTPTGLHHLLSTGLQNVLSPTEGLELDICGLARDVCVEYTYQDAKRLGFNVRVLEDLCRGLS